jgi:26S proteasome regulatory subunit N8
MSSSSGAGSGGGGGGGVAGAGATAATVVDPGRTLDLVVVHPLVLLGAVDHHYRVARDMARRRVVGVLLGETSKGRVDVTNSFALPFEDDPRDPTVFFLDADYMDT